MNFGKVRKTPLSFNTPLYIFGLQLLYFKMFYTFLDETVEQYFNIIQINICSTSVVVLKTGLGLKTLILDNTRLNQRSEFGGGSRLQVMRPHKPFFEFNLEWREFSEWREKYIL